MLNSKLISKVNFWDFSSFTINKLLNYATINNAMYVGVIYYDSEIVVPDGNTAFVFAGAREVLALSVGLERKIYHLKENGWY